MNIKDKIAETLVNSFNKLLNEVKGSSNTPNRKVGATATLIYSSSGHDL